MPDVSFVDTRPLPGKANPVEENLVNFFSRLGKDYTDKQDRVEIGKIIDQYQENRGNADAISKARFNLEKSPVSPTKRLNLQNVLNAEEKAIIEKDKALNAKTTALAVAAETKRKEKEAADKLKVKEEQRVAEATKKAEATANEVYETLVNSGEDPAEATRLSKILSPSTANARIREKNATNKVENKKTEKQQEQENSQQVSQNAYNDLVALIPEVGFGSEFLSTFGGEKARSVGEFQALLGALESILKDKVSKGTLSNARFNYIKNDLLPKANDTQEKIKGKLRGLATTIGLDVSALDKLEGKISEKKEGASEKQKPAEGMVRVKNKQTGQTGSVTPYAGMEEKYELIK